MKGAAVWAGIAGVVGFLIGFVGPIVFNPEANQGPLLGIFITGPGGAVFGALLGVLPLAGSTRVKILAACAGAGILAMFIFGGPQPVELGRVWDAEIVSCESPASLIPAAVERWEGAVSRTTWAAPRIGWKTMADAMPGFDPGVVVTLKPFRVGPLKQGRRFWNQGRLSVPQWLKDPAPGRHFSRLWGGSCAAVTVGTRGIYLAYGEAAKGWPPENLPNFLNLTVIRPLREPEAAALPR